MAQTGLVWFYGISIILGYLIPNPFLYISTVLFQTIQFSISTLFSFVLPIDSTLTGATTPGQSGPGSDGNKRVLGIPQNSSITGALPSDSLVPYLGHSLRESYPSPEMQSGYKVAPAGKASWDRYAWICNCNLEKFSCSFHGRLEWYFSG